MPTEPGILAVVTTVVVVVVAELDPTTWGTAAEWVAAVGTVAALFFALAALRVELAARRASEAESRADWERSRRSQARKVTFQMGERDNKDVPEYQLEVMHLWVRVTNHSDLPVFNVTARGVVDRNVEILLNVATTLAPGETAEATDPTGRVVRTERRVIDAAHIFLVDADGTAWRRTSQPGNLDEVDVIPDAGPVWPTDVNDAGRKPSSA